MYAAFTVFSLITPDQQTFDLDLQPYVVGLFVFALIIGVQLHWIAKRLSPYPDMPEKNADQHPPGWFAPIWVILKAFRLVLPR